MHLLVVAGEPTLAALLRGALPDEQHTVDLQQEGQAALAQSQIQVYDALIVDETVPQMDGLELIRRLRASDQRTPIVLLARHARPARQVANSGVDASLTPPFSVEDLLVGLTRIAAPVGGSRPGAHLVVGDLVVDPLEYSARRAGRALTLAHREYALLTHLMRHPGHVLSHARLRERVWPYGFVGQSNVVEAAVRRLRTAVDGGRPTPVLHTVRGQGYVLTAGTDPLPPQ